MIQGDTHKYSRGIWNENASKTKKNDILPSSVSVVHVVIINIIIIITTVVVIVVIVKGSCTIKMN